MTAERRGIAGRASWTLADQAVSSLGNFALTLVVARTLDQQGFAAYSLVYVLYLLALGTSRAAWTEPYLVRFSTAGRTDRADATAQVLNGAALGGLAVGAVLALGALVAGGQATTGPLLVAAIGLPMLLVQDAWRFLFIADASPKQAFVNDLVWTTAQAVAFGLILATDAATTTTLVGAWAATGALAGAVGMAQARWHPVLCSPIPYLRAHRDLAPRYVGEFVAGAGARHGLLLAATLVVDLSVLAGLRGAATILGPLNFLYLGALPILVPEGARHRDHTGASLTPPLARASVVLGGIGICFGLLLAALPDDVGVELLGDSWAAAAPLLLLSALAFAAEGAANAPIAGLRILAAAKAGLRLRIASSVAVLVFGLAGAAIDDARGLLVGLLLARWAAVPAWWATFLRAQRDAT